MSSCIRGYHVYRKDWNPVIEELLECERKIMNNQDRYAVVVIIVFSIFVFSVSDENFPHDKYFPIYGIIYIHIYIYILYIYIYIYICDLIYENLPYNAKIEF